LVNAKDTGLCIIIKRIKDTLIKRNQQDVDILDMMESITEEFGDEIDTYAARSKGPYNGILAEIKAQMINWKKNAKAKACLMSGIIPRKRTRTQKNVGPEQTCIDADDPVEKEVPLDRIHAQLRKQKYPDRTLKRCASFEESE